MVNVVCVVFWHLAATCELVSETGNRLPLTPNKTKHFPRSRLKFNSPYSLVVLELFFLSHCCRRSTSVIVIRVDIQIRPKIIIMPLSVRLLREQAATVIAFGL